MIRKFAVCVVAVLAAAGGLMAAPGHRSLGEGGQGPQGKSAVVQKIIVKVNGEIFTQSELERMQIQQLQDRARRQVTKQDLDTDEKLRAALGEITPDLLIEAIDDLLMVQRGRELGAKFTDEYFKNAVENIKKQNNLDTKGLEQAMAQQGMTMEELRQQAEQAFFTNHVIQSEIMFSLTEEETRQYYKAHPEEFMKPATVTLREVFVAAPAGDDAAEKAALAKLKTVADRAAKGEDFAEIVMDVSESASKKTGGLISDVNVGDLSPQFRTEIEKVKQGDLTAPIRTDSGYVVFKLDKKSAAEVQPYDAVREQIYQKVGEERLDVEKKKHIEKLRAMALIEWKDDGYRKLYEQRVAERKANKSH
jgi:parvulin-like peptidyl-prolyl isomerase